MVDVVAIISGEVVVALVDAVNGAPPADVVEVFNMTVVSFPEITLN